MTVRLLVYGDLHLEPSQRRQRFERPDLDGMELDAVVSVGDVVDGSVEVTGSRAGQRYERRARGFFEHLDESGVPTVVVPGDRDPLAATRRLVDGLDSVALAHGRVVSDHHLPGLGDLALVGYGCESSDASMTLPYTEFAPVDPRTTTNEDTIAWVADDVAEQVEEAVGGYLAGEWTVAEVADALGVHGSARERLGGYLDHLATEYDKLASLLATSEDAVVLAHRPPFNTALDVVHDFEDLDDRVHRGSLALKMSIAAESPALALSGHVHERGTDTVETLGSPTPVFGPGSPGVVVVELDRERGAVNVETPSF